MDEPWMTGGEAAAYLGLTKQRINQLTQSGELSPRRVGRFRLYSRAERDLYRALPESNGGRPKSKWPGRFAERSRRR